MATQTLMSDAIHGVREDAVSFVKETVDLFPKAVRFAWNVFSFMFTLCLLPHYGAFIFALYLWGERSWDEKLNFSQKILFWVTAGILSSINFVLGCWWLIPTDLLH